MNLLAVSDTVFPFSCSGIGEIAGGRIITVEHSLRSLSSGQLGDFPLYAFCSDGIRALTPKDDAFRDVQLISRDVPVSDSAFAPTDDGVCLISERGVLKVEGTSIVNLSARLTVGKLWQDADKIAYIYGRDSLVLYGGDEAPLVYDFNNSRWLEAEWTEDGKVPDTHWYAWPDTFFGVGNSVGRLLLETDGAMARNIGEVDVIPFSTRPLKFGSPFAEKRLLYVEAVWPDSKTREVAVYGANNLGIWHCLGRSSTGKMRLRGSGWRYFRIESYVKRDFNMENDGMLNYLKPLIICKIQEK